MTNRLERRDRHQEVGVRRRGWVCRLVKVDAPPGHVALVKAELVDSRVQKLPEREQPLSVGVFARARASARQNASRKAASCPT
jgi:hypothetical protein